jgi:hypothetical protein
MIDTIKDDDDTIIAYIEWSVRNKFGLEDPKGIYVYVHDIWVHKSIRYKHAIKVLSIQVYKRVPWVEQVYWKRYKYGDRKSQYNVKEFLHG